MNRIVKKKQMKLFLEYRLINRCIKRINKERTFLKKRLDQRWDKKRTAVNDAYLIWNKRRNKIYYEWNKITQEKIRDFPFIHKKEIMDYYLDSKRINDFNPFLKYYKQ